MLLSEATGETTIFLIQAGGFLYSYKFEGEMYKKSQFYLNSSYPPLSVFNDPSLSFHSSTCVLPLLMRGMGVLTHMHCYW